MDVMKVDVEIFSLYTPCMYMYMYYYYYYYYY